jgi:MYXO-CTERM domain-containing protein
MYRFDRTIVTLALISTWPCATAANPIATEVLRLRQVPHTTHVQITYASIDDGAPEPASASRDGTALAVDWSSTTGFTANTGSGLTQLAAWQACDCSVAAGQHEYAVTLDGSDQPGWTATMVVQENLGSPPDAGTSSTDLAPWDIPEPTEIQGLDCRARCEATTGPDTGPAADSSGGGTAGDDGGCAVSAAGGGPRWPALLVVVGLLLLGRRGGRG